MLTENDREILDENYRACVLGTKAANLLVHKVTDEKLALELNRQANRYTNLARKTADELAREYEVPRREGKNKAMLWTELQLSTLKDSSNAHAAELMIRQNTSAVTEMMKAVKTNQGAKRQYCELAEEIMNVHEKAIENLKTYLK